MSYDTLKGALGRDHITIVEVDMPSCSLVYGNSPCTASVGVTGSTKCYNTFRTCQDPSNFDAGVKTYRFMTQNSKAPVGVNMFPCIVSVSSIPTRIDVSSISTRATVKVVMSDFTHHDRGVDPYVADRDFNPEQQGTFWGKFKARNFFFVGRKIRIKNGFVNPNGFDTSFDADFETRHYVIESVDGVDSAGKVTFTAKDILTLSNGEKAKAPIASLGKLSGDITNAVTTIPLDTVAGYPSSGLIRIGDELITYSGISSLNLTGCVRGTNNTLAEEHDTDDDVQLCLQYSAENVRDIIDDLLVNYASIDPAYIDRTIWDAETSLDLYNLSTIISEPTGVNELLAELTQQTNSNLWWDDRLQSIRLKPISTPLSTDVVKALNETNIIENSVKVKDDRKSRISRISIYYGMFDFTKNLDEVTNYQNKTVNIDIDSESDNEYGQVKDKVIYSRWIPSGAIANDLTSRMLIRLKDTPKEVTFEVDAVNSDISTGDIVYFSSREIQTPTGLIDTQLYIITEEQRIGYGEKSRYTASEFNTGLSGVSPVAFLIADNAQVDYLSSSDSEKETYGFISGNDGLMSNGDAGYKIA